MVAPLATPSRKRIRFTFVSLENLIIEPVAFGSSEVQRIIALAEAELDQRYGVNTDRHPFDPATFEPPHGTFLLGALHGEIVGGVGLRTVAPGHGEVKRLWVAPDLRRFGVGAALMHALEVAAPPLKISTIVLETGPLQPEAVALYEKEGWIRVDELPVKVSDYPDALRFYKDLTLSGDAKRSRS